MTRPEGVGGVRSGRTLPPDFRAFVELHQVAFRKIAVVRVGASAADDVVDEAMARLFGRWSEILRADDPQRCAYRILKDAIADHARALGRSREDAACGVDHAAVAAMAAGAGFEDASAQRVDVLAALRRLDDCYADVLRLYYLADTSVADIAGYLGITPALVKTRLYRGRARLREQLGADYHETGG